MERFLFEETVGPRGCPLIYAIPPVHRLKLKWYQMLTKRKEIRPIITKEKKNLIHVIKKNIFKSTVRKILQISSVAHYLVK